MDIQVLDRPEGKKWVRVEYPNGDVVKFVLPDTYAPDIELQLSGEKGGSQLSIAPLACNHLLIRKVVE